MSSYHTSFSYKDKNSLDENLIIVSFEPDQGFMDSFLSTENVSDDYYDGTKRFDYGAKYVSSAQIAITLMKRDGSDMKLNEFRSYAKWLTGARVNSWLDMYVGENLIYSFLGKFINLEQYKLDARTVGIRLTFSSVSPWAYSSPQVFNCAIGQVITVDNNNILSKSDAYASSFGIDKNGVLCVDSTDHGSHFMITDTGVVYVDTSYRTKIDNQSDDLYSYIYLDIDYFNDDGTEFSIKNVTLDEETVVTGISVNEIVSLSAKQFIISSIPNKIFGDSFNFVWPRLGPGINELVVYGSGKSRAQFTYRYPMKIGDCVIDTDVLGNLGCDCVGDENVSCTVNEQELYAMCKAILG